MNDNNNIPLKIIQKSKIEQVQVSLSTYKDKNLIDVRTYGAWNGDDEYKPTQKGVSLGVGEIDNLIEGLKIAREEAIKRGWLK